MSDELERYTAAYPKPPVDRGSQKYRTLIEGTLRHLGKDRQPPTLVVNGNPSRLYTGEDGRFVRPYAFGRGSNGYEIRLDDGRNKRVQFYDANTGKVQARLRAIVNWDDGHAQVDLHVISPSGAHAFFARPLLGDGSGFDVDSVDGAGPGIFSSPNPEKGTWLFYLNYWGNFNEGGYNFEAAAHDKQVITAQLTLVSNENTVNEKRETFLVPLRKIGDLVLVRTLQW
jgi:uncharacterized protein YfaP (DUF2135 family)